MAQRLRLPILQLQWELATGGWQIYVLEMWRTYVGYSGYDLPSDQNATDGMVHCLLAVFQWQERNFGTELEKNSGDRLLPDRLGYTASAAVGAGAPG